MMAFWRTFFMGVTLLLLAIALGPTGYINKKGPDHDHFDTKAVPAVCLYLNGHLFGSFNKALINLSLLMLLTSYVTRVVQLFTPLSKLAKEYLRTAPGNLMKKYLERGDNLHFFAMLAYVLFKAIYDIAQSMLFEVCTSTRSVIVWFFVWADFVRKDHLASVGTGLGHPQTDFRAD